MEDSLTTRLDEVEQELVSKLSLRSDDLQLFTARQDQLLQSHYHSMTSALKAAQVHLERLAEPLVPEINDRWIERRNLKRFWLYCEEQRQALYARTEATTDNPNDRNTNTQYNNLSTVSLTSLTDLSLD